MKQLIINADDLGLSKLTNEGIIYCFTKGIVTSATVMANGYAYEHAVRLAKRHRGLGIGVHLNLTQAKPLTNALYGSNGDFSQYNIYKAMFGLLDARQVEKEFRAQIEKVIDSKIKPTHLDGHKHIHIFPKISGIVVKLAKEYGIRAIRLPQNRITNYRLVLTKQMPKLMLLQLYTRMAKKELRQNGIATTKRFYGVLETGRLTTGNLGNLLLNMEQCTAELMCHPGYYDLNLPCVLKEQRETELKALTDKGIKSIITKRKIKLINYGALY
ncbi:MAG: ChbG/HpnK family deacetylase [Nanoarchaeota archaeon]|nr:ChbG/HpnK family deacetylase [Nanoarchaeota archaeon]